MNPMLKMKFYYDHVLGTIYKEEESAFHQTTTDDVVTRFIMPENVPLDAKILDLGCGRGYFLDKMKELGYTNVTGISLTRDDVEYCTSRGHTAQLRDMNFLTEKDESTDMLFARHSLEHSPFPYITLLEYNRVLRPNGLLYVEVPAPDCERPHETNKNHYSILGLRMWLSLLQRTGFDVNWYQYEMPITFIDGSGTFLEKYLIFVCRRKRAADIK